jgi:hypothetical protein
MATILRHRWARSSPLSWRGWTRGWQSGRLRCAFQGVVLYVTPDSWWLAEGRGSPPWCADDGQHARSEGLQARASRPVPRLHKRTPGHRDGAACDAPTTGDGAVPWGGAGQPWRERRAHGPQRKRCGRQRGGAVGGARVPRAREQDRAGDETTRGQEDEEAPHQDDCRPGTGLGLAICLLSAGPYTLAVVGLHARGGRVPAPPRC